MGYLVAPRFLDIGLDKPLEVAMVYRDHDRGLDLASPEPAKQGLRVHFDQLGGLAHGTAFHYAFRIGIIKRACQSVFLLTVRILLLIALVK
jgi:hypothetical protein